MGNATHSFLTIQQVAARLGIEVSDVYQLLLAKRLSQVFLLSGRARLSQYQLLESAPSTWPLARHDQFDVVLLTQARHRIDDWHSWPLCDIEMVYECVAGQSDMRDRLDALCDEDRLKGENWIIKFEPGTLRIDGKGASLHALQSAQDTVLVSVASVEDYEQELQRARQANDRPSTRDSIPRDSRRQRCRAVAQIIWERDRRATVPDLYRSDWIRRYGFEGKIPSEKTFREWIKDLNPDRSPGRRVA